MYTQFQATSPDQKPAKSNHRISKHPGGTAHACLECRRRKSRCDGFKPCTRCRDGAKEHLCVYVSQKPRIVPSQRALEQLSGSLQECRKILDLLFPSTDLDILLPMSRRELLDSALAMSSFDGLSRSKRTMSTATSHSAPVDQSDASLALEQLHETPSEYDEDSPGYVADDVNALSLSSTRQSSYVGSSSIATALKVIAVLCPNIMKHSSLTAPNSPSYKSERSNSSQQSTVNIPREAEIQYVDAYFTHFHPLIPMVNEQQFRLKFESNTTDDIAWLALMNMVLAMGCIAHETSNDSTHSVFYQRTKALLSFDSFGSGKIEIVQTLALMGGLYLHYCCRPNMAVAVIGAGLRMAYALGLHRKQPSEMLGIQPPNQNPSSDKETKRRTWWCLVCMDTWGQTTLGRPSMGDCFGPAISISPPSFDDFPNYPLEAKAPILVAATQFCEISAQIQDRLASAPCLNLADASAYDMQLETQYLQFPAMLRSPNRCPSNILVPRAIIKWQNQNLRLLLHRPTLLAAALSRRPFEDLALSEQKSIIRCRDVAGETILDIACESQPDPVCGWHASWYLFQAAMVPLVSLFYEHSNSRACGKWHGQVEMVLKLLQSMELWAPIAKKTCQVISELHQSSAMMPMDGLASGGATQAWDPQSPFLFDEAWTNSMWFNASDWPTYPLDPTEYANGVNHDGAPPIDVPAAQHNPYIANGQHFPAGAPPQPQSLDHFDPAAHIR